MQTALKEIDPVCGMSVDPAKAAFQSENEGKTYFFCGKSCKVKFDAAPEKYLKKETTTTDGPHCDHRSAEAPAKQDAETAAPQHRSAMYTCPMHPEIQQDHPGACPKCGMALEPMTPVAPAIKTQYTCPMHPQIVRDSPGACPICGMALEPQTVIAEENNPELANMTRRFWVSLILTIPVFALSMSDVFGSFAATGTDVAIQSAGITLIKGDLRGIVKARRLSHAVMSNIRQNLFLAFVYNGIGIPIAAGVLYPFFGLLLSPMIAAAAMSLSSVSVIGNALRLRRLKLD